ncbi:related to Extracellular metalloprotease 1 [Ramularia collo-cygni]|uniref:Related to Extracellular metalloprotease 1 n=1 Tax=Ramularia collo-cygni TaxID=112498 RepID=A0A2D3VLP5_9PEZI|nr:related to Extracellular metalloprotease 1 [Ramularia collo-cygni]CZT25776.1 related to Extracellular metalloprotease 1 [Ramularia collo-cygni]
MKFSQIFLAAASASFAIADYVRCGTPQPNSTHVAEMDAIVDSSDARAMAAAAVSVGVYVHVVTTSAKQGRYSQSMINEQISVMNEAYSSMGVSYSLLATDFTVNNAWATAGQDSTTERAMKQALKRGSYGQLDLYFLSDLGGGLLGFCYFPVASPSSTDRILDGCINLADSLPGGSATNYDEGMTAVHEVGHWFGLYHVFQGSSCSGNGDGVADTPIQRVATNGCPASQDSCPNSAGADSIHNYMDYSYDSCMYEFTSGQNSRATSLYQQYRAGK